MKRFTTEVEYASKKVEEKVDEAVLTTENIVAPVRRTLLKRYPTLVVLLIVFGVTATSYGAELLFSRVPFFIERPLVLFFLGLTVLIVTGKLHQKFG